MTEPRHMRMVQSRVAPPGAPDGLMYFVASTAHRDRHGTVLDPSGWEFDAFDDNPVFLLNHNTRQLPAGRIPYREVITDAAWWRSVGHADIDAGLVIGVEWDDDDPDPEVQRARSKYERGFMQAVSVSFEPFEYDKKTKTYTRQGLVEVSGGTVPSNTKAIQLDAPDAPPEDVLRELDEDAAAWLEARGIEVRWPTTPDELYAFGAVTTSAGEERTHIISVLRVTVDIPEDAYIYEIDPDAGWRKILHPQAGETVERKQLSAHPPISWEVHDPWLGQTYTDYWTRREVHADQDDAEAIAPAEHQKYAVERVEAPMGTVDLDRACALPQLAPELSAGLLRRLAEPPRAPTHEPVVDPAAAPAPPFAPGDEVTFTSGLTDEPVRGRVEGVEGDVAHVRLALASGGSVVATRPLSELKPYSPLTSDPQPPQQRGGVLRVITQPRED